MWLDWSPQDLYYGSTWYPPGIETLQDERAFIEDKVAAFRDHPALLAWYLNDELPLDYRDRLETHQEWLEELDPNHPTWVVLYQVGQLEQYRKTFDVRPFIDQPTGWSTGRPAAWPTSLTWLKEQTIMAGDGERPNFY